VDITAGGDFLGLCD